MERVELRFEIFASLNVCSKIYLIFWTEFSVLSPNCLFIEALSLGVTRLGVPPQSWARCIHYVSLLASRMWRRLAYIRHRDAHLASPQPQEEQRLPLDVLSFHRYL